jgi:type VI secretion system protein ImpC
VVKAAVATFVRLAARPGEPGPEPGAGVEPMIRTMMTRIDQALSAQLDPILHHSDFQRLEGTWRGLNYLVHQTETGHTLKIRVLNGDKQELATDFGKAAEFDQTNLFKKVIDEEYGTLGGQPFGLLVGDFSFGPSTEDVHLLRSVSNVAAAAHAPFVAAAAPAMFGLESFAELNQPRDLGKVFSGVDYAAWKSFRESEDARYTALTLPRVLARLPYGSRYRLVEEFNYEEHVDAATPDGYTWMSAAWAYAARVTDAFARDGWFMRTRGVEGGGLVDGLGTVVFTGADGYSHRLPTEVLIPDRRENELSELGFLPLLSLKNTDRAAFLGAQSCQKPKRYFDAEANANAWMTTKVNYLLCVSRFAHYVRVMARDRIGAFMEQDDLERWLQHWLNNYVIADPEAGEAVRAKRPLREAGVQVTDARGRPGWYQAILHLRPHFQLESLDSSIRLVVELPPNKFG